MTIETSGNSAQSLAWRGQWLGYLCLGVLVFFTWLPNSYYLMVAWPWIAVWQVGFLLLGIWAIWMLRQFKIPFRPLGYGFDWVVGLGAIALILSGIFAEFKEVAAWNISLAFCYVVLIYVFRNWLGDSGLTIQRVWIGLSIIGVITGIISHIIWWPDFLNGAPRNPWPLGSPNFLAGYILLVLPLIFSLAFTREGWQKVALLVASFLLAVALYTTNSRGGLLGFFVLILTFIGFLIGQNQGKLRKQILVGSTVALGIIALLILNNPRVQQIVKLSPSLSSSQIVQIKIDGESQDRLFMWKAALNIIKDRPLFGVGSGNMSRVYNLYRPIEAGMGGSEIQQLHSTPMHLLGEFGLFGTFAYGTLIFSIGRLWFFLFKKLSNPTERLLLYGVGGSLLAYSVSSLTDYQLESISISSTLIFIFALLIGLADSNQINQRNLIKKIQRRGISIGIIVCSTLMIIIWLLNTVSFFLLWQAEQNVTEQKLTYSYNKLATAATFTPWDPTANLLSGFLLGRVGTNTQAIINHFQRALEAAPYDTVLNQNLGIVYQNIDNNKAKDYFQRTIQLLPRNHFYTYYSLGKIYLEQQQKEKAITAFSLQGLIAPEFLTLSLWNSSPFISIRSSVWQETLNLYNLLLEQIPPKTYSYNQIYENVVILRWWYQQSLDNIQLEGLRPLVQTLILADSSPQKAITILNQALTINQTNSLLLLRGWVEPDKYLSAYFNANSGAEVEDLQKIRQHIYNQRNIRNWLSSVRQPLPNSYRRSLRLTYRNENASLAGEILIPREVQFNIVVRLLNLFPSYPRELPALDRLINQVRTEKLNLPHPTANNFQLSASEIDDTL